MDLISKQDVIDAVYHAFCYAYCDNCEKEMNEDLCGDCHRKYQNWSASKKIIEEVINNLPSAQPQYEELTPEEAASEIASGSIMSARYWLDAMIRLKQMGYAICRKR